MSPGDADGVVARPWSLADLLAPVSVQVFADEHYGRGPLVVAGHPGKFSSLFSWFELDRVLEALMFHGGRESVEVVKGESKVAPRSPDHLRRLCQEGHTLVVTLLERHHERVRALATALQGEIGERIGSNLYVSSKGVPGFPRHHDDHDVLVLQLEGSKHWRLSGVTRVLPTYTLRRTAGPGTSPEGPWREVVLHRGDLLYLPRGWWHEAMARDEDSMHLTVAIYPRTGREFATWLLDLLEEQEGFRRSRPLAVAVSQPGVLAGGAAAPPEFCAWLAEIAEVIALVSRSREVRDLYHRQCVLEQQPPALPSFPPSSWRAPPITPGTAFIRPWQLAGVLVATQDGELEILVGGRAFRAPLSLAGALRCVFSRERFSLADLLRHVAPGAERDLVALLESLCAEGIIRQDRPTEDAPAANPR
jgi:hypothetical protein